MNDLREAIATVLELAGQMIDELDDQAMEALAELINAASERLTQMEQELEGPIGGPTTSDLTPAMPSSNVEGFAYDDKTGRMLVRFLGKHPDREGPIYAYSGIPKNIFDIFQKGGIPAKTNGRNKWGSWWQGKYPSIGAAMYHLIRAGGYPYQRLT